jgi:hypothetical protein
MDDPETLDGRTSPGTVTMYPNTLAEGYAFPFAAHMLTPVRPAENSWIYGLPPAGATPSRGWLTMQRGAAPAVESPARRSVEPRPRAAFPAVVAVPVGAVDEVPNSMGISQHDWINGRQAGNNHHQSQYRYRHNEDANHSLSASPRPDAGRPETRLALH